MNFTGNKDIDRKILIELDDEGLFKFCSKFNSKDAIEFKNKYFNRLCKDENLWRKKIYNKFGNVDKNKDRTWKDFYLKSIYYIDKYKIPYMILEKITEKGMKNIDLIQLFIKLDKTESWDRFMYGAAKGGHKDLVEFFINKGADNWSYGLSGATQSGNLDLVDFFVKKGANDKIVDFNEGLYIAAKNGDEKMVNYFIKKGADDIQFGLYGAKQSKNSDLIRFFYRYQNY